MSEDTILRNQLATLLDCAPEDVLPTVKRLLGDLASLQVQAPRYEVELPPVPLGAPPEVHAFRATTVGVLSEVRDIAQNLNGLNKRMRRISEARIAEANAAAEPDTPMG